MKYEFIDAITSDVLFKAYGKDLKEVFENSAYAMFEIICDLDKVDDKQVIDIEINADSEKELLFSWLQELIAQVDIEAMFFSRFEIEEISSSHMRAKIYGQTIEKEKGNTVVKAVTNYKFDLKRSEKGYISTVSVDI